jgi:hypothetical protein
VLSSEFHHPTDTWFVQAGFDPAALQGARRTLLLHDGVRSLIWLAAAASVVIARLSGRVSGALLAAALTVMLMADLLTVDLRYLGWDRWIEPSSLERFFAARPVDQEILSDQNDGFRVLDLTVDPFNSARPALHHRLVGGYHAAKLRRMQDLIDHHLRRGSKPVLDMLDVRYQIERGENGELVATRNPDALGRAWLVDEIRWVGEAREELEALAEIDPARTAVIHREFRAPLAGLEPSAAGRVEVRSQRPDDLRYRVETPEDALLVLSEIWYGPDAGWHAWIDGEPTGIVRANYVLRALRIPAGRHEVRLAFEPTSFLLGRSIAVGASATLLIAGLIVMTRALFYRCRAQPLAAAARESPAAQASGTRQDDD